MLNSLGRLVRRRPWTTAFVLVLLALLGAGAGVYGYALRQWEAAQEAIRQNRAAEAREKLQFCLLLWPRSVPVHLAAARAARLVGEFAEAEAHLNRCNQLQKGATSETQLEFLLMRVQTGEVDEVAPQLFLYADQKHPESELIFETIAQAYLRNHRYGPAMGGLDRWMQEYPESAKPYYWRGWVRERMSDHGGAVGDYQRAVELDPEHVGARLRLAELLLEYNKPQEAVPHLERLRTQVPDRADVMARLGQCRFLLGDPEDARRLLEAAVAQLPDDPALLIHLARLELQEGRPEKAEQWVRRVLKNDVADMEAQYTLVASLQQQGRREEAAAEQERYAKYQALLKRANRLLQEEAERPSNDAAVAHEIGSIFLRIGQDRLGLHWLHQALERNPRHQPTHQVLAEYHETKGEPDKAAAHRRQLTGPDRKAAIP